MDGLKTVLLAGITAVINSLIVFDFLGWTPEQKLAVISLFNTVIIPSLILGIRILTKSRMPGALGTFQEKLGVISEDTPRDHP